MDVQQILNDEPDLAARIQGLRADPDLLVPVLSAKIKLTWRCNLKCSICGIWERGVRLGGREDSLTGERIRTVLASLAANGLRKIHFSGGEVLLRPDLEEIIAQAQDLGLQVNLTTNGTLMDKRSARFLVEHRVNTVVFSIDGATARRHDRARGVHGAWDRTWKGVRLLQDRCTAKGRGPRVAVNTVVTRRNVEELDDLHGLLKDSGIESWRLLPVRTPYPRMRPTAEQWARLAAAADAWRPLLSRGLTIWKCPGNARLAARGLYGGHGVEERFCFAPWLNLFIDANGEALTCCTGRKDFPVYGNVLRASMEEVLGSAARREVRCSMATGHVFESCRACDEFWVENEALARMT